MKHTLPASWMVALALALLGGVGSHAAPVVPRVEQWNADAACAVRTDSAWILSYLANEPRTGDRIADSLYLALLEGEDAWAAAFLDRQHNALEHAVARLGEQDAPDREVATGTLQTLEHYRVLIAVGQADQDAFQRLLADRVGPHLHEQATNALEHGDK